MNRERNKLTDPDRKVTDHVWYSLLYKLYIFVTVHRLLESSIWYTRLAHDIRMTKHRRHTSGRATACHVAGTTTRHHSARRTFWNR